MKTITRAVDWLLSDRNMVIMLWVISALALIAGETHEALTWAILGLLFLVLSYLKEIHAAIVNGVEIKFTIVEGPDEQP